MVKTLLILLILSSCLSGPSDTKAPEADSVKSAGHKKPKVISDPTNTLTGKVEDLELEYIVWGCACANWVTVADWKIYADSGLEEHCIFIEPADSSLELPIYFDAFRHRLKVNGQFYTKPDYPKGTIEMEEHLDKAKVFRYTKMEVINDPGFNPDAKVETLVLNYNAVSCNCAQWSESKFNNHPEKRNYYWLEPASDKLMNADTLFKGDNLPLQVKVTGQLVTENGLPKKQNFAKAVNAEFGKVFRYTKIELVQNRQNKNSVEKH